jgi:adrenodoxin-NADP+ reductase
MGTTPASLEELEGPGARPRVRIDKLLREAAALQTKTQHPRQISLRFLLNPVRFEPSDVNPQMLGAVVCERTKLEGEPGKQRAVGTGEEIIVPAQMVSASLVGCPFAPDIFNS